MPRFAFEKFPQANDRLTTQMKSVGEVMAIGSTFQESIQKACAVWKPVRTLTPISNDREEIVHEISEAGPERIFYVADAFRIGMTLDEVHQMTDIDMWFLVQIKELIDIEKRVAQVKLEDITKEEMLFVKKKGFSDKRLASVLGVRKPMFAVVATHWMCIRSTSASIRARLNSKPVRLHVFDLSGRVRGHAHRSQEDHGFGRRSQSHRAGYRV